MHLIDLSRLGLDNKIFPNKITQSPTYTTFIPNEQPREDARLRGCDPARLRPCEAARQQPNKAVRESPKAE